jgi:hypothetical protein
MRNVHRTGTRVTAMSVAPTIENVFVNARGSTFNQAEVLVLWPPYSGPQRHSHLTVPGTTVYPRQCEAPLQQQKSRDAVAVLNETGDLKQGSNKVTLEFRRASDNQLADVGNVQVESTMEMKGMSSMLAKTNVTPSGTAGRYNDCGPLQHDGGPVDGRRLEDSCDLCRKPKSGVRPER